MPRSPLFARAISTPTLIVAALLVVGCGPGNGVGRPCEVGTTPPATTSGQVMTLSSPALECPSRICLLPSGGSMSGTGALCTAGCDSDVDCEDGERGAPGDLSDPRCKKGFACMWPTTVGAFACQKMCVCRDFVGEPAGGFQRPASCP